MRTFRDEDVRERKAVEGDGLHERVFVRDARGCELVLVQLRAEHAALSGVREAWLGVAERNFRCQVPGVVPLVDFGASGETACATRDRAADALPLSALLALLETRGEAVSTLLAVHIARELCAILAGVESAADGGGLVHGDLSAERVFVREHGRLMVTELGFWTVLPPVVAQRARGAGPFVERPRSLLQFAAAC